VNGTGIETTAPGNATAIPGTESWTPMWFGEQHPRDIADPLFEPRWPGRRVLADVVSGEVTIRDVDLGERPRTTDFRDAMRAACVADELILDGYLLPGPLPGLDDPRLPPPTTDEIKRADMVRQLLLGSLAQRRTPGLAHGEPRGVDLPADGPIAFVAVDLLWLDGAALIDLPLGERKRLLESAVVDGDRVRRELGVRAPADRWHAHWRSFGHQDMAVKGANSRYVPGGRSRDWTTVPIPRG
jgi:hypothetical protein